MQFKLTQYVNVLLEILLPNQCSLCNSFSPEIVCYSCLAKITPRPHLNNKNPFINKLFSLFCYENEIKQLLALLKFEQYNNIGKHLAAKIKDNLHLSPFQNIDYWIPVPIHKKRLRKRGFNQVDILFKHIAIKHFPGQYKKFIRRIKNTSPLFELSLPERQKVLKNAFVIDNADSLKGKNVVIIDDIHTSGSTVTQIAKLLRNYGVKNVSAFTFAYVN